VTLRQIVDVLGGTRRLALELDVNQMTIRNWINAGRIHSALHCLAVANLLLTRGYSVSLWELAGYRQTTPEKQLATG